MTEQKNSSEKTEKTDKSDKASAPKKHSIEPKSARGASTTARRKTAKEADDALQDKIEKARGRRRIRRPSTRADRARHAADQQEEGRDDVRREGRCKEAVRPRQDARA